MANVKIGLGKHGTHAPMYKGVKKEPHSTNNVECEFRFFPNDIKPCVSGNKKTYVLNWPIVPDTWLVKTRTNLLREEVLAPEDARF